MAESHSSSEGAITGDDIPDEITGFVHVIEHSPHRLVFEMRNGATVWGPLVATEYRVFAQALRSRARQSDGQGPTVRAIIGKMSEGHGMRVVQSIQRVLGNPRMRPAAQSRQEEDTQTIYAVESDRVRISHNRTPEGAALAIADDVRERMARLGSGGITDAEHDMILRAALDRRHLDINIHARLGMEVPGMPIERIHQIAIAVARDYGIKQVTLTD